MSKLARVRYLSPASAGPYVGTLEVADDAKRGDEVRAMFGRAVITGFKRKPKEDVK